MKRRIFVSWLGLGFLASAYPVLISALITQAQHQKDSDSLSDNQKQSDSLSDKSRNLRSSVFYVATNGNDAWSGRFASPNATKTDGPFATLERARDSIRQLKQRQGTLKQPVTILIREGNYFLTKPLVLTPIDSGAEDAPITYAAYKDEKPVISGGRRIQGWREERVNGRTMWTVTLPEVKGGNWYFQQLWVNGQRRNRCRYPNKGYLEVEEALEPGRTNRFRFKQGDLQNWPSAARGGEAILMNRWIESRLPIVKIDLSERIINFAKKTTFDVTTKDIYYLENIFETLDAPGEWYLNRSTGKLYYIPMPGEQINRIEAIAPTLASLLVLSGKPLKQEYVENINFHQLTFSHSDWEFPSNISGFIFQDYGVPGVIFGSAVRNCSWKKCTIANVGTYAMDLFRSCRNNTIVECEMFDLGAGGVKLGERRSDGPSIIDAQETNHNKVVGNQIYNGGTFFTSAVGISAIRTNNNRFSRNTIHDLYYSGIVIAGPLKYKLSRAHHNIVEFNHVHHIGTLSNGDGPVLDDKGGIYTAGVQPGTVIRGNTVHDIQATGFRGWGIYLDGNSSQIVVENNLVYRTTDAGFFQHYGKENIIRNNIFAFGGGGRRGQIRRGLRPEPHLSFTFERNIVYWRQGQLLGGRWEDLNFAFDRNLYWYAGENEDDDDKIKFANMSWQEWRAKGMDRNSIIADPMFIAPERGDFRLRRNSPAFKLGFRPLPNSVVSKSL